MFQGQSEAIFGDWFLLRFIENEGMAFGWSAGGEWGKLLLSVFRIVAVILIWRYLKNLIDKKAHKGLISSIALILAGAVGNIIDSMFYGMFFTASPDYGMVAEVASWGSGYAADKPLGGFLYGSVVDMLYFPMWEGTYPEWFPWYGGEDFLFFRPVFNVADTAISFGVGLIIFRQKAFFGDRGRLFSFRKKEGEDKAAEASADATENDTESSESSSPEKIPSESDDEEATEPAEEDEEASSKV